MRLRALTALLLCETLFGQGGSGTISGSATDASGAIVEGVVVEAINETTGFRRDTTVGSAGTFTMVGLQPGTYTVTAEQAGFKKFSVKGLILQVDQNACRRAAGSRCGHRGGRSQ